MAKSEKQPKKQPKLNKKIDVQKNWYEKVLDSQKAVPLFMLFVREDNQIGMAEISDQMRQIIVDNLQIYIKQIEKLDIKRI